MKKVTVLIADDNKDLLSSLQIQFRVHGYEVVTCTNTDLAVAYAQKHRPDVILADIWMDGDRRVILDASSNGLCLPERLGKLPEISGIPIIYITGNNSPELDLRAKQLGAYGLVRKPVNFSALLKMVESAVKDNGQCSGALPDGECDRQLRISSASELSNVSEV
jgi:two-component system chemotaxis response regulator CheY